MKRLGLIALIILAGCMKNQEKFDYLMFGEIKPAGWIREQMDRDLSGFTGHLDELVPDLIVKDDIYGKDRLTKRDKNKDVGNIKEGADWEIQYLWWNSESQSNWRDGHIRQAILTGNEAHIKKAETYLEHILRTQDSNGYLGIYDKNLRYNFKGENGELWAKATLLRGMLAYFESDTGNQLELLNAIKRAVKDVMVNYPADRSDPFKAEKSFAGVCHGLVFTDILDRLHQLTGEKEYLDYATFLYRNYSQNKLMEEDICLDNILNPRYKLKGHGVHTYEHLRALTVASYATGDQELKRALDIFLRRIDSVTTPSGGPVGDEWIGGRKADATLTGYEYCSLQELLDSYTLLLQKSGNPDFGDKVERIFFNAAQGARHPVESSIAYLKSDNSFSMMGSLNDTITAKTQTRYKYSPVHQDVAVCCIPNAGRIAPYYVRSMWMRDPEGLSAMVYGPCELTTVFKGQQVSISEITEYPYDYRIRFRLTLKEPARFTLKFRLPYWAAGFRLNQDYRERKKFIEVRKIWKNGDEIILDFIPQVIVKEDLKHEHYFTFGPLVLARPIEGEAVAGKGFPLPGYRDVLYKPKSAISYRFNPDNQISISDAQKLIFRADLINTESGRSEMVELVPMGHTILRQVTFK
jgi:uncharacterized protein